MAKIASRIWLMARLRPGLRLRRRTLVGGRPAREAFLQGRDYDRSGLAARERRIRREISAEDVDESALAGAVRQAHAVGTEPGLVSAGAVGYRRDIGKAVGLAETRLVAAFSQHLSGGLIALRAR